MLRASLNEHVLPTNGNLKVHHMLSTLPRDIVFKVIRANGGQMERRELELALSEYLRPKIITKTIDEAIENLFLSEINGVLSRRKHPY